jgi:hypothetical protein
MVRTGKGNYMPLYSEVHKAALATDKAWQAELERVFGKRAGDMRYTKEGKGTEGGTLRAVYNARRMAQEAWYREMDSERVVKVD